MIDEIMKTFKKRVKEHKWIDDKTTKSVFEKVSYSFLDILRKINFWRTLPWSNMDTYDHRRRACLPRTSAKLSNWFTKVNYYFKETWLPDFYETLFSFISYQLLNTNLKLVVSCIFHVNTSVSTETSLIATWRFNLCVIITRQTLWEARLVMQNTWSGQRILQHVSPMWVNFYDRIITKIPYFNINVRNRPRAQCHWLLV